MANEQKNSLLTETQRKFLQSGIESGAKARMNRKRIRDRVEKGLADFEILAEDLDEKDRDEIFGAEPFTMEREKLMSHVGRTIEFLYTGLGGDHEFSGPLKRGVSRGEVELGNIEYELEVEPRFAINPYHRGDPEEIVDIIEAEEWDRLRSPDVFTFLRLAVREYDAVDFERIREVLGQPGIRTLKWDPPRTRRVELSVDTLDRLEEYECPGDTIDETINRALDAANDDKAGE